MRQPFLMSLLVAAQGAGLAIWALRGRRFRSAGREARHIRREDLRANDIVRHLHSLLKRREQVLLDLMINAMASNTANGVGERILEVASSRYDKYSAAITVIDTGPGIAAAYRRRIFDAFFSTKKPGMGLGLAIARTTVQAHGGRIRQEGTPAGGAAFKFTIPLQTV